MSEQYAFAIGFDVDEGGDHVNSDADLYPDWAQTYAQVESAIAAANLPPLSSPRWDEFGLGRIFWGTQADCQAVKDVLSAFPVYIEEAQNLEAGCYATDSEVYYVTEAGAIYRLPAATDSDETRAGETDPPVLCNSIPMEAYRLKTIAPEQQAQIQSLRSALSPAPEMLTATESGGTDPAAAVSEVLQAQLEQIQGERDQARALLAAQVAPEIYAALQQQCDQQLQRIQDLEGQLEQREQQLRSLEAEWAAAPSPEQVAEWQSRAVQQQQEIEQLRDQVGQLQSDQNQDFDPSEVQALQQTIAQQSARIAELEAQLAATVSQAQDWQARAESAIHPDRYVELQGQVAAKTAQIMELKALVKRQERTLTENTALMAQKVDLSRYQAVEQEAAQKSAQMRELRQTLVQMERDLQEWQMVAESKVDWSEHQALQVELQQLQLATRKRRGILSRFFGWLFG